MENGEMKKDAGMGTKYTYCWQLVSNMLRIWQKNEGYGAVGPDTMDALLMQWLIEHPDYIIRSIHHHGSKITVIFEPR